MAPSADAELASPWQPGHQSKARLLAGASGSDVLAGVEITMAKGWKTYWRVPGDAGGVPPGFDWSQSVNLARAEVLYPAPRRLADKGGETIGYKDAVVFPVRIAAADPSKPVELRLQVTYGICLDLCIPAETTLTLEIPAGTALAPIESIAAALAAVPRAPGLLRAGDPRLASLEAVSTSGTSRLVLAAQFEPGDTLMDAFVEGPLGSYVPMPQRQATAAGERQLFVVDMTADELKGLQGQELVVTLIGSRGSSETRIRLP